MTLGDLLARAAARWGERPAVVTDGGGTIRYDELAERVERLAGAFARRGVATGDRIAVVLPNGPEMLVTWFALARLGAVMVPCDPARPVAETAPLLERFASSGMIADAATLAGHRRLDLRWRIVAGADSGEPTGAPSLDRLVAEAGPSPRPAVAADAPVTILQTSGTTGLPKGALLSHASYSRPAVEFVRWMEVVPEDRFLACLPLFHMAGQALAVSAIAGGAALAFVPRFSASAFWSDVARHRATLVRYLGEMLAVLCARPEGSDERESTLRAVYGGGARREVVAAFERRFGVPVVEGYGLTETNTVLRNELARRRPGSIGRPVPYCDVRVADAAGHELPPDRQGEIQVRRNPVMSVGYLGATEADDAAFCGEWFRTGDLGYRDADGYFYFVGRDKDIIRRRGENIAPAQIEAVLDAHPGIECSAVVGVADVFGGEEIKAYLVPRPHADPTPDALVRWCRDRLAEFEVPRYLEICPSLPGTSTNKIAKGVLRKRGTAGGRCWDRRDRRWLEAGEGPGRGGAGATSIAALGAGAGRRVEP